ncbi:peptide chain release factor N(5)-glutamine methyltransferase [Buchnera aphidicola]|uniref:peptide chain release factor N(5)-glutamine methyltransferase n=1 Tax=Buchnera aphidicola TaxID=9 RepID=UPI0034648B82
MKISTWLKYSKKILSHLENPLLDSEVLLSHVIKKTRTWINIFDDYILNIYEIFLLKKLLIRRFYREPIAYIIKKKEFWSLSLIVTKDTLIPRPETEILVEQSLLRILKYDNVLDLGTGCGAVSLSIAFEERSCNVFGIDYNRKSIHIARKNAKNLNLKNVCFFFSNWFSTIQNKFNIIVSNPPYISIDEIYYLKRDVKFEPYFSLISKNFGMSSFEHIISHAPNYLLYGGWLLLEHSPWQKFKIMKLLKKNGFFNITTYKDYIGYDRVTVGQKLNI